MSVTPEMNYEEANLLRLAKEELGETPGGGQLIEKETWWWNQHVKEATKAKKDAFKKWQLSREEQDHDQNKVKKNVSKKAVAIAKENTYEETRLNRRNRNDLQISQNAKQKNNGHKWLFTK